MMMKKNIKDEGLQGYNINENRGHAPDEIVIKKKGNMWEVYHFLAIMIA